MSRVKTPTRIQLDVSECGASCLGIVLEHFGHYATAPELRRVCGVSRAGLNAAQIVRAAKTYGLEATGRRMDVDELRTASTPAILHWRFGHFVVLEGFGQDRVYINDPESGHQQLSLREFDANFTGIVLTFEPTPELRIVRRDTDGMLDQIRRCLEGEVAAIAYVCLISLCLTIPTLFFVIASRTFVDEAIIGSLSDWARPLLWILGGAIGLQALLSGVKLACLRHMKARLSLKMATGYLSDLVALPIEVLTHRFPSELAGRLRLADRVADLLSMRVLDVAVTLVATAVYLTFMMLLSWTLTLMLLAALASNILGLLLMSRRRIELGQALANTESRLLATGIETIECSETLRSAAAMGDAFRRWHHRFTDYLEANQRLERTMVPLSSWSIFTTAVAITLLLGVGGYWVITGQLTLGTLIAFQLLTPLIVAPIHKSVMVFGQLHTLSGDLLRLDDVSESARPAMKPSLTADVIVPPIASTSAPATLAVDRLSFTFSPAVPATLREVSFEVAPGEWIGVCGHSGCGKSTLARLLARLYQPTTGNIQIAGIDVQQWDESALRQTLGFVDQENSLPAASIRDAIQLWGTDYSDREILEACRDLDLLNLINQSPLGLGMYLEEGGKNLSGGERQRLDLARILLQCPSMMILDEATSSLDADTEAHALMKLRGLHSTTVFVTHRPAVLSFCDRVLLLRDGQVEAIATHDQLLAESPYYRSLLGEDA